MRTLYLALILVFVFDFSFGQDTEKPLDNYTIKRLLVCNDNDELLVVKYNGRWNVPALRYNQRESINQALYNLAKDMGIVITAPKVGGIFSFTYGFNDRAALRMFYVTTYKSGTIKTKLKWDAIKWIHKDDFMRMKDEDVYSLMAAKVVEDTSTLWGGAFFLFRENEKLKYSITEDFYPIR